MNKEMLTLPDQLYHSYVIEGDPTVTSKELLEYLSGRGDVTSDNPDLLFQIHDSFTIADAGPVQEWHSRKKMTQEKKVCIIATKFINREAEQSLLKILEEPKEDSHIFIIVPTASVLAPTILSRVHVVKGGYEAIEFDGRAISFIRASIKDRLDVVAELIDEAKDDETSGGLRHTAMGMVSALEKQVYKEFQKDRTDTHRIFVLEELQMARTYLGTPGASVKMILEHIACVL